MTDTTSAADAIPFRTTDPERLQAEHYYDVTFFKAEKEKLWPHGWQMACRLEDMPNVGDHVEYTIFDKSVIIVHGKTGVKAFHNACRHRGVHLVTGPGNYKREGFICPFHGWRFNIEDDNIAVFGKQVFSEELLDKAKINLAPCRIEFWAGCAFINFDDDAPGLRESLSPVAERMVNRHADKQKMNCWYAIVLPTNWKLVMEVFQKNYHVMKIHPADPQRANLWRRWCRHDPQPQPDRAAGSRNEYRLHGQPQSGYGRPRPPKRGRGNREIARHGGPKDPVLASQIFYGRANDEIMKDIGFSSPFKRLLPFTAPVTRHRPQ
ncbi:MAG TPA: Rieske 2Fe-2S domain-containing protein [Sphingobium sp.]